jgi:hypothetical protein
MKVPVTLWVNTFVEMSDDATPEQKQFFVEENHCIDNIVISLANEIEDETHPHCHNCTRGGVILGHHEVGKVMKMVGSR